MSLESKYRVLLLIQDVRLSVILSDRRGRGGGGARVMIFLRLNPHPAVSAWLQLYVHQALSKCQRSVACCTAAELLLKLFTLAPETAPGVFSAG